MTADPVSVVIKTCSCSRAYDADAWAKLPLCGHMMGFELRHCLPGCGSTIAIEQPKARAA